MPTLTTIYGKWNEDGSATVMGRITARDGTGATQLSGRKLIKQADLSSITCKVFDLGPNSISTITPILTPTIAISSVIFDTLQTTWEEDEQGFNFAAIIAPTAFPDGNHTYLVEFVFTTTGGTVMIGRFRGKAESTQGS